MGYGGGGGSGGGGGGSGGGGGGSGGGGGGSYAGGGGGVSSSASPPTAGAFRYNTDSSQLEIYDGNQWTGVLATSPEQQTGGTRMVIGGGLHPGGGADNMLYVNVSTTGNSQNFGEYAAGSYTYSQQSGSSRTRGIFAGGYRNNIEYITISTTGDSIDFGDKIDYVYNTSEAYCSNSTRMLTMGGYNNPTGSGTWTGVNQIQKIEMSTLGNSQDFGDAKGSDWFMAAVASPTRAVFGSATPGLQYVNFATQGNYAEFGTIANGVRYSAHSNAVRGVFSGTSTYPGCMLVNIASQGNAVQVGDLSQARNYTSASGSPTRGVITGGTTPSYQNTMDFYQIMSTGDLVDFGDLNEARARAANLSNGHGGL